MADPDQRHMVTRRTFVRSSAILGSAVALSASHLARGEAAEPRTGDDAPQVPAFPGAEGAGKYTVGGRGGAVYEVTNLNDSGAGSLRDAVSAGNRTVVFRVSGNINLESGLTIAGSNITIAGQTAPGDGISVNRYTTDIKPGSHDIIMRYMRFRFGDISGGAGDAFDTNAAGSVSPQIHNLIIDHCSFSWAVDECLSPYGNFDVTVQWCIVSEGLALSAHPKGLHGYGGLWGGDVNTYHHNLIAHQGGRNPRFSFTDDINLIVDHRNNVIYNYGYTSCYGGEWSNGINIVGNYYKPGPNTLGEIAPVIVQPYRFGQWFIDGNYVEGHPDITADNSKGIDLAVGGITKLTEPVAFENGITEESAQDAYGSVLDAVGAILPRRDAVDARIVNDARNGTGRAINSQNEVGGWPPLNSTTAPVDSDHDGIPDAWEKAHGLDPNDPADAQQIAPGSGGYTWLEVYLNSITPVGHGNPTTTITSPAIDQVFASKNATQTITITADAAAAAGETIAKVEFYVNETKIGQATKAPYKLAWKSVADGSYSLTARATDGSGTATTSSPVAVFVNQQTSVKPWKSADIGKVPIAGSAALKSSVFTIKGSGKIQGGASSFHFVYQPITAKKGGLWELTARVDSLSRVYNNVTAGLMIRDSLAPDAPFMYGALGYIDEGVMATAIRIADYGADASVGNYPYDGTYLDLDKPYWIRLSRRMSTMDGDSEFEASISEDSLQWTRFGYERIVMPSSQFYIGLAVDGGKQDNAVAYYTTAQFSLVELDK